MDLADGLDLGRVSTEVVWMVAQMEPVTIAKMVSMRVHYSVDEMVVSKVIELVGQLVAAKEETTASCHLVDELAAMKAGK